MDSTHKIFNVAVIVAALGYFVDVYDLILFSIVRVASLKDLGLSGDELTNTGINLLNVQMVGMLLGGIIWGVMGDKKGRLSVLFLTILMYSLANILNGMVVNLPQYYFCRFFAGLGLAGELGVGITLVSEVMSKETRGYGTTIVSSLGIAGAVIGFMVADLFNWRVAYYFGGGMGLMLLALRVLMYESGMYHKTKKSDVKKGNFMSLFNNRKRFIKYIKCILIGVPVWYIIGILVTLAPEFASANAFKIDGEVVAGKAVMYHYIGASLGAFFTGVFSQLIKSRKKALLVSLVLLSLILVVFFVSTGSSSLWFYTILLLLGIPNGYWSVFVTSASEQFGTNLRATVTTTVPNFVRGATVVVTNAFTFLKSGSLGIIGAAIVVGVVVIALAIYSSLTIEETYHKDLDYYEVG
ncbi:MAG: MFS transporter [Bacteroidetes bacterium]|nr:MFS transporter [Bacteroidota bacterium]